MRFARQARIFRGTLDSAAIAGVFLLLVIFMLLTTLIRTPGVLVELGNGAQAPIIRITRAGEIIFDGKTYAADSMPQLREDLKRAQIRPPYTYQREAGAPDSAVERLRILMKIELPVVANITGTTNPTVTVAVNFAGQCFFDNKLVSESELRTDLLNRVAEYKKQSRDLTLVLYEDKDTRNEVTGRLEQLAWEVGVKEVLIPSQWPGSSARLKQ